MKIGSVILLTGYSGSGKSTIAKKLEQKLKETDLLVELLDGDIIRQNISKDLGFSKEDRLINIQRIGFIAQLLSRNGINVIISAISPYRDSRQQIRDSVGSFIEVFVNCPLEECEKRDVKGLYKRARSGAIPNFTGISDVYEPPLSPEVVCNTQYETVEESVEKVLAFVKEISYGKSHLHQAGN